MFTDPQSVTVAGVAKSMPRIQTTGLKSVYQTNDELFTLTISHQVTGERIKTLFRLDQKAVITNPLDSSNDYDQLSVYLVIERPKFGFSSTQVNDLAQGMFAALNATAVGKLYGKES